jgi:hypothetical protein
MRSAAAHSVQLGDRHHIKRVDQRTIVWDVIASPRTAPAASGVSFQWLFAILPDTERSRVAP